MNNIRKILPLIVVLAGAILWVGCQSDTPTAPGAADNPVLDKGKNPGLVETLLEIPARAHMEMESGCSNNPGPYITLYGEIALAGVDGRLIFRNATNGPHERTEDVDASVVLLPAGEMIRFNKQPPLGGAGGNPWIYVVFTDDDGNAYTDPVLLGRCVQGLFVTDVDFFLPALCSADVTVGDCSNSPGPFITIEGEIALSGLNARLIFTNNAKFTHVHEEDVVVDVVILPAGESITFAKQPPLGGVGGNPKIWFQFTDGEGGAMSEEFYLGRCVQLSK
jgi:hypothetical protein